MIKEMVTGETLQIPIQETGPMWVYVMFVNVVLKMLFTFHLDWAKGY